MSTLVRTPFKLLAGVGLVVVLLAAIGVLVVRTDVGRAQLAAQVEAQFDRQYTGSLTVGQLSGNLLWRVRATDVVVRDPHGRVVIAADEVAFEPRWRSLLSDHLEVRRIELRGAVVDLVEYEDGGWNIGATFSARHVGARPSERRLDLSAASIRLSSAAIRTSSARPAPAIIRTGAVLDYRNAELHDVHALINARVDHRGQQVRIRRLSGDLVSHGVHVERLRGHLISMGGAVDLRRLELTLDESTLQGDVRIRPGAVPELRLRASRLHVAEVRRLIPALPVSGDAIAALQVAGPLDHLRLARLDVRAGDSRVRGQGVITGLPASLAYELDLSTIRLRAEDLRALHPALIPEGLHLEGAHGSGSATGKLAWAEELEHSVDGQLALLTDAGRLRGRFHVDGTSHRPLRYDLALNLDGLDLAQVTGNEQHVSRLSGSVTIAGRGTNGVSRNGGIKLTLGPSSWGTRELASGQADLRFAGDAWRGTALLEAGGWLAAEGTVDLRDAAIDVTLEAVDFDLSTVLPAAPRSAITGDIAVAAVGRSLGDLVADATVRLDSSFVEIADSDVWLPAEPFAVSLRPIGSGAPRVTFESEALVAMVEGDFDWQQIALAGDQWWRNVAATVESHLLPRLDGVRPVGDAPARWAETRIAQQDVRISLSVLRANALKPWIQRVEAATDVQITGSLSSAGLRATAKISTEGMQLGQSSFGRSDLDLILAADSAAALLDGLALELTLRSEQLHSAGSSASDAAITASYDPQTRRLALDAAMKRAADSLRVAMLAGVDVLDDRFAWRGDLSLALPGDAWAVRNGAVDLYSDGLAFRAFEARRIEGGLDDRPSLALSGIASARASDTLNVQGQALSLDEVLSLFGLDLPFDGLASADLDVTGVLGQPAIVGIAHVDDFTIWGDPAGRLFATSEIVSGREGFGVDIRLSPADNNATIRNHGRLHGELRLPGRFPDGSRDPGFFDLTADLERLDLFIFDHLFPDIVARSTGGASGRGSIRGDWSFPLFEADLRVAEVRSHVPAFNLDLQAAGRVTVDRQGIHLHEVALADKAGGRGRVNGGILFNEYRYFSFDLTAQLHEFEVIDVDRAHAGSLPFYGHIRASGSATLTGPIDNAFLRSPDAVTTPDSKIYIPVVASGPSADAGFLVFTDADGNVPETEVRRSLIAERPEDERPFLEGLEMLLNLNAPSGSTVSLVFDPVIGDMINAVGSANLQLAIIEGEFRTYGTFEVERGDYLFTAGDVFTRRFELERGGTLEWSGDPIDARLNLPASYRTRASLAGLGLGAGEERQRVPFVVHLQVGGHVTAPLVDLSLDLDESGGRSIAMAEALRRRLNEPDRQAEYATSVLLTNTFLLAPSDRPLAEAADDLFYTSLSELVSSRLNLFLNQALGSEHLDVAIGVQQGTGIQEFDLTYGVALRLLDERLIIRGEGVYHQLENGTVAETLQGEVVVEARVSDAVSIEVFYRREGDVLLGSGAASVPVGAYGAGVNYQTQFVSWQQVLQRLFTVHRKDATDEEDSSVLVITSAE